MNAICEETACQYNKNMRCIYWNSDIKSPYARVCMSTVDDDSEGNFE